MNKGQFDTSVKHSLYQAARKMELDETQVRLEKIILKSNDAKDTHYDIDQIKELPMHRSSIVSGVDDNKFYKIILVGKCSFNIDENKSN